MKTLTLTTALIATLAAPAFAAANPVAEAIFAAERFQEPWNQPGQLKGHQRESRIKLGSVVVHVDIVQLILQCFAELEATDAQFFIQHKGDVVVPDQGPVSYTHLTLPTKRIV